MPLRRVTVTALADQPGEQELLLAWLDRWAPQIRTCSENSGCGCCLDSFDLEVEAQALAELPPAMYQDIHRSGRTASKLLQGLSMRRIDETFQRLRADGRKALIPFITAGDPSLEATVPVMHALVRAGADVIELGVPFSDPMADGPTIQRSSERALGRGAGLAYVLEAVHEFRREDAATPVVLMGYLNPIEIHGTRRFAQAAVAAGVDGLLLVDLPPEEAAETRAIFTEVGLALIALASPTTSEERLDMLCSSAQGYLYYVSFAGVTGASNLLDTHAASDRLRQLRRRAGAPVVAGFGIKDAASAAAMAVDAEGVVVGSALVAALAEAADVRSARERAEAFLAPLRQALDR